MLTEVVVGSEVITLLSHLCSKYHLVSTALLTCRNRRAVVQGYCDTKSDVVVSYIVGQWKQDESVILNRGWKEYEEGLGNLNGKF